MELDALVEFILETNRRDRFRPKLLDSVDFSKMDPALRAELFTKIGDRYFSFDLLEAAKVYKMAGNTKGVIRVGTKLVEEGNLENAIWAYQLIGRRPSLEQFVLMGKIAVSKGYSEEAIKAYKLARRKLSTEQFNTIGDILMRKALATDPFLDYAPPFIEPGSYFGGAWQAYVSANNAQQLLRHLSYIANNAYERRKSVDGQLKRIWGPKNEPKFREVYLRPWIMGLARVSLKSDAETQSAIRIRCKDVGLAEIYDKTLSKLTEQPAARA